MPLITKAYTFQNGIASDAIQVNQDMDTLYNLINGLLDAMNIANNGLNDPNKFASEVITQAKSKGLIYSQDLYSQSWVVSGGVTTASGSPANQITVTTLVANILQTDGSYRHVTVGGATYVTSIINATYYLELQPDGTMNWSQTHSVQANYMPIATVTSNASGNINVITDNRVTSNGLVNTSTAQTIGGSKFFTAFTSIQYSGGARFELKDTTAGVDAKKMDFLNANGNLQIRLVSDNDSAASNVLTVTRSGVTPLAVSFSNGSFATKNNTLDDGSGNATIAGALTVGAGGSFANSKAAQGYQKLPGGVIMQWGRIAAPANAATPITNFPLAFPTVCVSLVGTHTQNGQTCNIYSKTLTAYAFYCTGADGTGAIEWQAIGY